MAVRPAVLAQQLQMHNHMYVQTKYAALTAGLLNWQITLRATLCYAGKAARDWSEDQTDMHLPHMA